MVKYVFWIDTEKEEKPIKSNSKRQAEKRRAYYKKKGYGVSRIRRIIF